MFAFLSLLACAHRVSWEVQPRVSYALPSVEVAVVAEQRECKRVADELVTVLAARPGVVVKPGAEVVIGIRGCDEGQHTVVEMEFQHAGLASDDGLYADERRYVRRSWATAEMSVRATGTAVVLPGAAEEQTRSPWGTGNLDLSEALAGRDRVRRALAHDLADNVAPLPETIRRMVYRDPEPGTARQLHNAAVEAERGGNLQSALEQAMEAYAANPSSMALRYVESLRAHAESVGYALREPETKRQ